MKLLKRNLADFYYKLYVSETPISEDGYETGEYTKTYGTKTLCHGNVSPAKGYTQAEMFGTEEGYDKVLIVEDPNCPIDENSILWVDDTTATDFDYIVVRVARSLNNTSYAIRKVNVS